MAVILSSFCHHTLCSYASEGPSLWCLCLRIIAANKVVLLLCVIVASFIAAACALVSVRLGVASRHSFQHRPLHECECVCSVGLFCSKGLRVGAQRNNLKKADASRDQAPSCQVRLLLHACALRLLNRKPLAVGSLEACLTLEACHPCDFLRVAKGAEQRQHCRVSHMVGAPIALYFSHICQALAAIG